MRLRGYLTLILSTAVIFCSSCSGDRDIAVLSGSISNPQQNVISLEIDRLHYKFSEPNILEAEVVDSGTFEFRVRLSEPGNFNLIYNNKSFPVYLAPGEHTQINFQHAHFPGSIRVSGYGRQHYETLLAFLRETESLSQHKQRERQKFIRNQPNEYLNTHRNKISRAKEFLGETPFNFLIHRYTGEYLVARLQDIRIRKDEPGLNLELARLSVLREARIQRFFTYESFIAQRAGIRDFAHEWIQTFGTRNRIESQSDRVINWIVEAGEEVRANRWALLEHVNEPRARRHALMYLIAEEMGDFNYAEGINLLEAHKNELVAEPAYLDFLIRLKEEIGITQPGMDAIPFNLPLANGQQITLDDVQGKYVLLDFWASWCVPCIQEIPYMTELYDAFHETDFEIISISLDESEQAWAAMLSRFEKPWMHSFDGTAFNQETFRNYRAGGIPFYVLIGRDGTILRNNDFRPSFNLSEILEDLIFYDLDHSYAGQR